MGNLIKSMIFIAFAAISQQAFAVTYDFTRITNNGGADAVDIGDQLFVDVSFVEGTDGGALFTFRNEVGIDEAGNDVGGIESSIMAIYFDYGSDSNFFSTVEISAQSGTSFSDGATPPKLPYGGAAVGFEVDYSADADPGGVGVTNGVDSALDSISFLGTFGSGSFSALLSALSTGDFRIGLHVQGITGNDGFSDSYVNTVPVPAAAWLFGSALLGLIAARRRKNQKMLTNFE